VVVKKILTFGSPEKKPPGGDSEHLEWYVCFSVHQQWAMKIHRFAKAEFWTFVRT